MTSVTMCHFANDVEQILFASEKTSICIYNLTESLTKSIEFSKSEEVCGPPVNVSSSSG